LALKAEIETIDTWRFANRSGSREEATRQLIKLGLDKVEPATTVGKFVTPVSRQILPVDLEIAAPLKG